VSARFHSSTSTDGAVTVAASGEIDMTSAEPFREALTAGAGGGHLTIDLTAVQYLDSAGIRVLCERVGQQNVDVLVEPGSAAAVAVEVSGLVDVVTVRHPGSDTGR
jgi:anti-anti-sigma factor